MKPVLSSLERLQAAREIRAMSQPLSLSVLDLILAHWTPGPLTDELLRASPTLRRVLADSARQLDTRAGKDVAIPQT